MDFIDFIASSGVSACLLESRARKPGNVYPGRDFEKTSYSDFLRGSRALRPVFMECAKRGFNAGCGKLSIDDIGIGSLVRGGVLAVKKSHKGGNTHLGIIMLCVPLAVSAGFCLGSGKKLSSIRLVVKNILLGTTVKDSLGLYDAINIAGAGGLGKSRLDVKDKKSKEKLKKLNLSLLDVMKFSSRRDMIARELSSGFPAAFNFVAPNLLRNKRKARDLKKAVVQTYLQTLAKYPDTLISRKLGVKAAKEVSKRACYVLKSGGVFTKQGNVKIREFDSYLRSKGNKLNPGTTADLIAAGLFLMLLQGRK